MDYELWVIGLWIVDYELWIMGYWVVSWFFVGATLVVARCRVAVIAPVMSNGEIAYNRAPLSSRTER